MTAAGAKRRGGAGIFWGLLAVVVIAAAGFAAHFVLSPGKGALRTFDPVALGRAEADAWRAYYERRHADLAASLVAQGHDAFGLSRADAAASGLAAAKAARIFQASTSRAEAQAALPDLTEHFTILGKAAGADFDPAEAARLELEWWQLRRETPTGEEQAYAPAIAAAMAHLYGAPPERLADYARLRAEAMDLRDARGQTISEADWAEITRLLEQAYIALAREVGAEAAR